MNTPCRVLLVEDEPGDAHLVRQFLLASREPRFDIVSVATLAEARRHLQENPADVLLLDLSLPDSSGLDTVRAGRQAAGGLPIIVLTGRDDTAFALQTIESGAQDYLLKGNFDTDTLVRAIRYAISRSRLEQRLQDSEERWRFALEGTGDGMWDWNVQSGEVFFSRRWKEMLGFAEDEIDNSLDAWKERVHPEDMPRVMADLQAYFDDKTPSYANEHRVLCKDGGWKWVLDRGMVISRTADGKPLRMIGTHADITKRKAAADGASAIWRNTMPSPICPTGRYSSTACNRRSPKHGGTRRKTRTWPCCSSTSTSSSRSTIPSATPSATCC